MARLDRANACHGVGNYDPQMQYPDMPGARFRDCWTRIRPDAFLAGAGRIGIDGRFSHEDYMGSLPLVVSEGW